MSVLIVNKNYLEILSPWFKHFCTLTIFYSEVSWVLMRTYRSSLACIVGFRLSVAHLTSDV